MTATARPAGVGNSAPRRADRQLSFERTPDPRLRQLTTSLGRRTCTSSSPPPGFRPLTTHLFVEGSPYIDSDAVFGVKESLVREFPAVDDPARAAEAGLSSLFRTVAAFTA